MMEKVFFLYLTRISPVAAHACCLTISSYASEKRCSCSSRQWLTANWSYCSVFLRLEISFLHFCPHCPALPSPGHLCDPGFELLSLSISLISWGTQNLSLKFQICWAGGGHSHSLQGLGMLCARQSLRCVLTHIFCYLLLLGLAAVWKGKWWHIFTVRSFCCWKLSRAHRNSGVCFYTVTGHWLRAPVVCCINFESSLQTSSCIGLYFLPNSYILSYTHTWNNTAF